MTFRPSERNVIVVRRIHRAHVTGVHRLGHASATAAAAGAAITAAATATAEQHDAVGANLRRLDGFAFLVGPLTRLDASFAVDLLALRQVLVQRLRGLA